MMKKAGDILQEARIKKNMSVEEVSEATKIRPSYINALEKSDYSAFHSSTTIKGFIKNYAVYLNLNPDNVIAIYRREQNIKTQETSKSLKFKIPNIPLSANIFIIFGAVLIVAFVIAFFTYQYIQVSKPPQFDILEPANSTTTMADKIVVRVLKEKDQAIDLEINNKQISTIDENGNYFTTVDLIEGQNKIIVTATNGYKKQTTKEINVIRNSADEIQNKNLNIILKSLSTNKFNLSYKVDDSNQVDTTLTPGQIINLVAKKKLQLSGPVNMHNLIELLINDTKISLKPNIPKQEILYDNNQININTLP